MKRWPALGLAVVIGGACGGGSEELDRPRDALPTTRDGNFVLYVSNQSFDAPRVDIRVAIDGRVAVDEEFDVEDQHNWVEFRFRLRKGDHTLTAASRAGEAKGTWTFTVTGRNWAIVEYWYYPGARKRLTFELTDEQPGFA